MSELGLHLSLPDELLERIAQRAADILEERGVLGGPGATLEQRPRFVGTAQAARYWGCDEQRIYDLRYKRRITRHRDGRRALVDLNELDELAAAGEKP